MDIDNKQSCYDFTLANFQLSNFKSLFLKKANIYTSEINIFLLIIRR